MKNTFLLGVLFASAVLFAGENAKNDNSMVQHEMEEMTKSMMTIQRGFLTKNTQLIKDGGLALIDVVKNVKTPPAEDMYKERKSYHISKAKSQNIIKDVEKMIASFEKGNKYIALDYYTDITKQCMSCHTKIRQW